MVQRTFYALEHEAPPEKPAWEPAPDDVHTLRHGYNLVDLDRLTRASLWRVWGLHLDYQTRYDLAWSAITEALYAAPDDEPPSPSDLIHAGQDGIGDHVRADGHAKGQDRHRPDNGYMRGYAAYWETTSRAVPGPETRVVEREALWQIWPRLTNAQRRSLLALAAHGTYHAAADSLGIAEKTFKSHIGEGRRRFLDLWHEHEAPSRVWGIDRRIYKAGGEQAEMSYRKAVKAVRHRKPRPAGRVAVDIKHGTINAYNRHGCRCKECVAVKSAESTARRRKAGNAVRRQMTVSQFADAVRRGEAGESWVSIARDFGFSDSYLRSLRRGDAQPIPDPIADDAGSGKTEEQ